MSLFCSLDDLYLSGESFRVFFSFKQVVSIKTKADGYISHSNIWTRQGSSV